ncbi:hypothetical protein [Bathymodiolus platifrons methanotrophic gill symbiont]|uniref:hypothetical protein n=1 Tax=Bathymodiolus platifrons methanotrophic gill symbiont TaxID=113268 RepID=UPI001C8D6975|nr:hypothetical protein [Bathymodiolus platifrons methanotrophic gill symbiont]
MATSNGSTAIRDKILASLARYRALRIGKFPCAFWRLSSRPGLTANGFPDTRCSSFSIPLPSNYYLHPAEQYFNDAVGSKRPKSLPIICFPDGIS